MQKLWVLVCAVGLAVTVAAPAKATTITLSGGTAGTIPSGVAINDFIGPLFAGPTIGGYYGPQIVVSPTQSQIRFDFYGAQADFHNEFNFLGSELFDHAGGTIISPSLASPLGSFSSILFLAGVLPFSFDVNNNAGTLLNGSNVDNSSHSIIGPNFFASCNPFGTLAGSGGRSCNTVYLFLDDSGGGPDNDYDDFLVRVDIQAVPEPATLGLFGLGLVGLRRVLRRSRA